jgi:hypothetical protein
MKKILVPLFLLIISFNAYGEWKPVFEVSRNGNLITIYVDFDNIKTNGNVYHWELLDKLKPDRFGDLSAKILYESDCNVPQKRRMLSQLYYTQPMGEGSTSATNNKSAEWQYPIPETSGATVTDAICAYANQ